MSVIRVENLIPGFSAIRGHEHSAFIIRPKSMAQGSHINDIGIFRIDHDSRNVPGVFESYVPPGLSAIGGFIDTIPEGNTVADVRLPGPGIDDIGIAGFQS